MKRIKVGIIGCGTIGGEIAKSVAGRLSDDFELVALADAESGKAEKLRAVTGGKAAACDIKELVKASDLVVEAASAKISADVVKMCIESKKSVLVMSVGGLIGNESLLGEADSAGVKLYIPSGAVCGIDGIKAASAGNIDSVTLTTTKPPKGLDGAPYIKEKKIDLSSIKEDTVIFEGSASDAIKGFPQNVNVSAVLSLAGIGAKKTRVRIVASPGSSKNVHEVEITGDAGRIVTRTENVPSASNPKTSALAIFSAMATLKGIARSVRVGT